MVSRNSFLVFVFAILIFSACKDATEYPIEPVISFKSLTAETDANGNTSSATLVISFTDGDGDVGSDESSALDNFFVTGFLKINNVWTEIVFPDSSTLNGRIETLTPDGRNKSIRGDISFQTTAFPLHQTNRPMRYEVYLYDRALHRSNTVTTSEIIVTTP